LYFFLLKESTLLHSLLLQLLGFALGSLHLGLFLGNQVLELLTLLGGELVLHGLKLASML
jgi:hypothetical protein